MPAANILVNAVAGSVFTVPINVQVQLSNQGIGGETTYNWSVVDQPEGTANNLSNALIQNPTFTPTKEGSYLIKLVVNLGLADEQTDTVVVRIAQVKTNLFIPAAGELLEADALKGWALATNRLFQKCDDVAADANVVSAIVIAGLEPTANSIVRLGTRAGTILAGLPGEKILPAAVATNATTETNARGILGICIGAVDGGAIAANKLVLVRLLGLVDGTFAGSPAIGDLVFLSNTGTPALTPGTVPRVIGRVAESSGGAYRWAIHGVDGGFKVERRVTHPTDFRDGSAGAWAETISTGVWNWTISNAAGGVLHAPLRVYPGDVIYKIEIDIDPGSTTALISGELSKTRVTSGGAQSAAQLCPAQNGQQIWDFVPGVGLTLPVQVGQGEAFNMRFTPSGANGTNRKVGAITAFVRPA